MVDFTKNVEFKWADAHTAAVKASNYKLSICTKLQAPDPKSPFGLRTDTLVYTVEEALKQKNEPRMIVKMSETQRRCAAYDQTFLAFFQNLSK